MLVMNRLVRAHIVQLATLLKAHNLSATPIRLENMQNITFRTPKKRAHWKKCYFTKKKTENTTTVKAMIEFDQRHILNTKVREVKSLVEMESVKKLPCSLPTRSPRLVPRERLICHLSKILYIPINVASF